MNSSSEGDTSTVGCLLILAGIGIAVSVFVAISQKDYNWLWGLPISAVMLWTAFASFKEEAEKSAAFKKHSDAHQAKSDELQAEISELKREYHDKFTALRISQLGLEKDQCQFEAYRKQMDRELEDRLEKVSGNEEQIHVAWASLEAEKERVKVEIESIDGSLKTLWDASWTERSKGYPTLSAKFAEAWLITRKKDIDSLRSFATKTMELRARLSKELRDLKASEIFHRNLVEYYESLFPWIEEFRDDHPPEQTAEESPDVDLRKNWLSDEEWTKLSEAEKSQQALERYIARRKSKWEIGIEYERWCGYRLETQGWSVSYHGAIRGFDDLGRDIIARKIAEKEILIVQCKRWSSQKEIHEKHVFQTFGTTVAMRIDEPDQNVRGLIATTTTLSSRARGFAELLGVEVLENKRPGEFPRIKCNRKSKQGDVYHLPFDQKYDQIVMRPEKGDFYCMTANEAEGKGFRRAMRWFSS